MASNKVSDRMTQFVGDDGTFESEHGRYMRCAQQMDLDEAGYLVPMAQFQERLERYVQEIQGAVRSYGAE